MSDAHKAHREECAAMLFAHPVASLDLFIIDFGTFIGLLNFIGQAACIDWLASHPREAMKMETEHAEFMTAVTRHFEKKRPAVEVFSSPVCTFTYCPTPGQCACIGCQQPHSEPVSPGEKAP
jgi:hypothetical protein